MPTLNWHEREEAVRAATRAPCRLFLCAVKKDEQGRAVHRQLQDKLAKS